MSLVQFSVSGAVAVVTLTNPPVNALSFALADALEEAIDQAGDPAVRAVVITGDPFAAGADINTFVEEVQSGAEEDALAPRLSEVIGELERLPKPVIAAVRGYALGGGLELAMGADFRYLASDARVGQTEIRLGIIPGAGGTQRLTRLVGLAKARDIVYSGRFVGADEALAIGLADRIAEADELLEVAVADAHRLAAVPTLALGAAKAAINEGWGKPIDEALAIEIHQFQRTFRSDDAREGVAAFLEKREPTFGGS